jgi:hypothetical protein
VTPRAPAVTRRRPDSFPARTLARPCVRADRPAHEAEAKRLLGLVAGGKDPTRVTHGEGFGAVMERYLALREPAMKPRSFTGAARYLRQHAKPLHRLALADIDSPAIAERLGRLRRSHHRTLNGTDLGPAMSGGFASWENLTLAAIVALWFGLWLVA